MSRNTKAARSLASIRAQLEWIQAHCPCQSIKHIKHIKTRSCSWWNCHMAGPSEALPDTRLNNLRFVCLFETTTVVTVRCWNRRRLRFMLPSAAAPPGIEPALPAASGCKDLFILFHWCSIFPEFPSKNSKYLRSSYCWALLTERRHSWCPRPRHAWPQRCRQVKSACVPMHSSKFIIWE